MALGRAETSQGERPQSWEKMIVVKMWFRYKGILLSHKNEWDWVICCDVDEPRVCCTEWCEAERANQVSCINAYIWSLEKWCWLMCLQGGNRDTDVENGLGGHGEGKRRVGWTERAALTCRHYHAWNRWLAGSCCVTRGLSSVLCDALELRDAGGGREARERGYMHTNGRFTLPYCRN